MPTVRRAGTNIRRKLAEYAEEEYRRVLEVNLFSAIEMCRLCLPFLGKGSSVVNVSSVSGVVDTNSGAPYGMSKAALIQLSRNLAVEWAEFSIRVNTVSPWYTDTPLVGPVLRQPERLQGIVSRTPMGRVALAEEVAAVVAFLAMDKSSLYRHCRYDRRSDISVLSELAYFNGRPIRSHIITGQNIAIDGGMLAKGL